MYFGNMETDLYEINPLFLQHVETPHKFMGALYFHKFCTVKNFKKAFINLIKHMKITGKPIKGWNVKMSPDIFNPDFHNLSLTAYVRLK